MMFDAEAIVEPEFVTQLKLAPQLFVTLVRIHARLTPDMGKMGELHFVLSSSRRRRPIDGVLSENSIRLVEIRNAYLPVEGLCRPAAKGAPEHGTLSR